MTSGILIKVRGLAQGENPISLTFDASLLDYPGFHGKGMLSGTLKRMGDRLDLQAEVSAAGEFECTRCADTFQDRISAPLRLQFVPPSLAQEEGDPNVHTYDPVGASEIDILQDVRDALVLAIPMKHLCRPDCKGLCPVCGKNWNREECSCSDSEEEIGALAALKGLRERLRAEENE
ncbi:MAG TPA: DUF177 domain-containing protein [Candidatus Kapabacteria bacterium]|nr:DUF177 domain-containing protein [Candidatus Kapabacteria bacterium]